MADKERTIQRLLQRLLIGNSKVQRIARCVSIAARYSLVASLIPCMIISAWHIFRDQHRWKKENIIEPASSIDLRVIVQRYNFSEYNIEMTILYSPAREKGRIGEKNEREKGREREREKGRGGNWRWSWRCLLRYPEPATIIVPRIGRARPLSRLSPRPVSIGYLCKSQLIIFN